MNRQQIASLASAIGHALIGMSYSRTYRWSFYPQGGSGDCSSYTQACFLGAGFPLLDGKGKELWTSTYQVNARGFDLLFPASVNLAGREHAPESLHEMLQPGDIILFDFGTDDRANTIDHAAFVDADGNIINERSSKTGIKVDPITFGKNNTVAVLRIREDAEMMDLAEVSAESTTKLMTRRMQILLNVSPSAPRLLCDAEWGDKTTAALNAYKASQGLAQDGICTRETWERLIAGLNVQAVPEPEEQETPASGNRLLLMQSPLMKGAEVTTLQAKLSALGYAVGEIDGVFGRKTEAAVIALQTNAMEITTSDGIADESVLKLLGI
jgi:hypothetical protein